MLEGTTGFFCGWFWNILFLITLWHVFLNGFIVILYHFIMFVTSLFLWYCIIVNWVIFQVGRQILVHYTKIPLIKISNIERKYTAVSQSTEITVTIITCSESNPRDLTLKCYQPEIKARLWLIALSTEVRFIDCTPEVSSSANRFWTSKLSPVQQWSRAVSSGQRFQVPEWAASFATVFLRNRLGKINISCSTQQKSGTSACELPPGSDSWGILTPKLLMGIIWGRAAAWALSEHTWGAI